MVAEQRRFPVTAMKPPPDRLYGRRSGHRLRPRQLLLLEQTLPRLALETPLPDFPRRHLEVGFGGGEHVLAQIAAEPDALLIACEVFANGICSLLSRLVAEGGEASAALPRNLRVFTSDARRLIAALPAASLDRLFLMFPDPWPKIRHAKRRFVHPSSLPALALVLRAGAEWRIATDDPTYQHWVAEVLAGQTLFEAPPPARTRPALWPPTRYEAKALAAGRTPLYWSLIRTDRPVEA